MVDTGADVEAQQLRETLMLCCPQPDGMAPIGIEKLSSGAERDNLQQLLLKLGLDYIAEDSQMLEETRGELDPQGSGRAKLDDI